MRRRTRGIKFSIVLGATTLAIVALAFLGHRVVALPNAPAGQSQLVITEVTVGAPTPDLLRIVGQNLDNGPSLDVSLGEFASPLVVVSATATEILAALPQPFPAGDFLLTVSTGNGASQRDVYDLTGGAVPAGGIILWDQSSDCPVGFARVSAYDGRFLVSDSNPGDLGGSNTHSHGAGTFTVPPHRHTLEPWDHQHPPVDDNSGGTDFNAVTGPGGGAVMTGTSAPADSRPEFVTILLCRKT